MDLTNTLSHADYCMDPVIRLGMESSSSYLVEIGRDGTIYVPEPDGKSFEGSVTIAQEVSCTDCGAQRAFTGSNAGRLPEQIKLDTYNPQIRWGKHAPTLENTIIKAMTDQQPNTPVNMRMVERLASSIQDSWLIQPTLQELGDDPGIHSADGTILGCICANHRDYCNYKESK